MATHKCLKYIYKPLETTMNERAIWKYMEVSELQTNITNFVEPLEELVVA